MLQFLHSVDGDKVEVLAVVRRLDHGDIIVSHISRHITVEPPACHHVLSRLDASKVKFLEWRCAGLAVNGSVE